MSASAIDGKALAAWVRAQIAAYVQNMKDSHGITRIPHPQKPGKSKLLGDVAYDEAAGIAADVTPAPGGVGPMTIVCRLANTLTACCRRHGLAEPEGLTA